MRISRRLSRCTALAAMLLVAWASRPCVAQPTTEPTTAPTTQPATTPVDESEVRKTHAKEDAAAWTQQNATKFGNDADYIVKPNLLIDKKHRTVTLKGYATGLSGNGPVEFFLISPASGKGYESIAVSLAQPSDLHAGLEAIGIPPGRPVNYAKMRFWPKGERVRVTYAWEEGNPDGTASKRRSRAEELLISRATQQPLPPTGLVFVGSMWLDGENGAPKRYYADLGDPGAIASTYNEATTVLDVPSQSRQSTVYQSRIVNPAYKWIAGQPLEITFEPEHPAGPQVLDVSMTAEGDDLKTATYSINADKGLTGESMIAWLQKAVTEGHEPFVTVTPSDTMTIKGVRSLFSLMESLEADKGIRLEPPEKGHLFHEAFSPEESLRDYRKRTWQPVEVHVDKAGKVTLIDIIENETGPERLTLKKTDVATPEELAILLKARADQRRPIAVYVPGEMKYGDLRKWLAGGLTDDGVVWVYLE